MARSLNTSSGMSRTTSVSAEGAMDVEGGMSKPQEGQHSDAPVLQLCVPHLVELGRRVRMEVVVEASKVCLYVCKD
jgi:hypothetical protein